MSSPARPTTIRAGARRWLHRLTGTLTVATAGGVLLLGAPVTGGAPSAGPTGARSTGVAVVALVSAHPHRWPGHPGRRIVVHRVRPGDTATGLAVRFHAWTDELRALNHLGRHARLYVGERVRIPVVLAALRAHRHHRHHRAHAAHRAHRQPARHRLRISHRTAHARPWALAGVSRGKVRRVVVRLAREHGVGPRLALALAWQESGWQQRRISSAGAIGVMQVLPGTARWMSAYVGHPLNPYGLYDNVTAGVVLIRVLHGQTGPKKAIGAYFQGLGSVQRHGMNRSTKAYVRNVLALRQRLAHGWNPV